MNAGVVEDIDSATGNELIRLYRAYRISWLNKTYYAVLADRAKWVIAGLQVVAALASTSAFYALRQNAGLQSAAMWFALVAAACSFIVTFVGLTRDQTEYKSASSASAELHAELKNLITQMLRMETATDEQKWLARYLLSKQTNLESKDVGAPKVRLIQKLTKEMNRLFPDNETAWEQF